MRMDLVHVLQKVFAYSTCLVLLQRSTGFFCSSQKQKQTNFFKKHKTKQKHFKLLIKKNCLTVDSERKMQKDFVGKCLNHSSIQEPEILLTSSAFCVSGPPPRPTCQSRTAFRRKEQSRLTFPSGTVGRQMLYIFIRFVLAMVPVLFGSVVLHEKKML